MSPLTRVTLTSFITISLTSGLQKTCDFLDRSFFVEENPFLFYLKSSHSNLANAPLHVRWGPTIQLSLTYMTGILASSYLSVKYRFSTVSLVGALITCAGYGLISVATTNFDLLFFLCILPGVGMGLLFFSAIFSILHYTKQNETGTSPELWLFGLVMSGAGLGHLIMVYVINLLSTFGLSNRMIALVLASIILVYAVLMWILNTTYDDEQALQPDLQDGINTTVLAELITFRKDIEQAFCSGTKIWIIYLAYISTFEFGLYVTSMFPKQTFYIISSSSGVPLQTVVQTLQNEAEDILTVTYASDCLSRLFWGWTASICDSEKLLKIFSLATFVHALLITLLPFISSTVLLGLASFINGTCLGKLRSKHGLRV